MGIRSWYWIRRGGISSGEVDGLVELEGEGM